MEIAAAVFIVFLIAVAAIAFFVLRRAVKMAIRAVIVALILLIAVIGGVSLWMFAGGKSANNSNVRPPATKNSR